MSNLRVHYFQHIVDEGLGSPESWLKQRQAAVTTTEFFRLAQGDANIALPLPDEVDLLIIMGGEMSVNDEDIYPWLIAEKQWIRHFIDQGKPVVGLCLGAQLIASSLGATVTKNEVKEIGWWPVYGRSSLTTHSHVFPFPDSIVTLSWHEDTFDIPIGAVWLAENEACPNQAFQYGNRVLGFQFHPEITAQNLEMFLLDNGYDEMISGMNIHTYIQQPEKIAQVTKEQFYAANQLLEHALDFVIREK
jgi:GMP synthase-like glutamine amidotransferase